MSIESGLASAYAHDIAALFGQVYRVNGWNPMSVWDGYSAAAVQAGIAAPSATWDTSPASSKQSVGLLSANGNWLDVGIHLLRYRYANSKTQYVGNPGGLVTINAKAWFSGATTATDGTGSIYTVSGVAKSGDPKVDRIIFEMTDAGGRTFFKATTLANSAWTSVAFQTRDRDLRGNPIYWDEFGHDPPPFFSIVEAFRGRLWGLGQIVYDAGQARILASGVAVSGSGTAWTSAAKGRFLVMSGVPRRFIESVVGATHIKLESNVGGSVSLRSYKIVSEIPDVLYWSKALYPESFPFENRTRVFDGRPEKAKAIKGYRQDLVLFGERSMERMVFSEDPFRDGGLEPVQGERGAANRRCVQDVGGLLYALDYKGIHSYGGGTPQHISRQIDPLFDVADTAYGYVDFQYRSTFHSVHYPARAQILWFVVINGEPDDGTAYTTPHHAIAYDYETGIFTVYKFDVGITASSAAPGADGTTQTLLADENGRVWVFGVGDTDGAHNDYASSFIVKSGTNASNILASNNVLYASGDRMDGAFAYWVEGNETKRIQSNSAAALVLVTGFSSAPSPGDTITLGRIPAKWKSKAFFLYSPSFRRFDGRYLHLFYEPKSSGEIRVRFYLDRSSTAYTKYDEDFSSGGVSMDATNDDFYVVDLTTATGYARVPMPSEQANIIEFEIEIVDSATQFEMTGYEIEGYAEEDDVGS